MERYSDAGRPATRPIALVTGASAGIGRDLAEVLAESSHDLVLVARSADRLEALAAELRNAHGARVEVVPADLADPDAPARLHAAVGALGLEIDILVNNAGVGSHGEFVRLDLGRELEMIRLNVLALAHLTGLFLPEMVARGHGRVMNVASVAAFQPGPLMATYYATKAFVLHFSEALAVEVVGSGVTVTALCPGPTHSEFHASAGTTNSNIMQMGMMASRRVAEIGYRGMMRGRSIVVPGLLYRLLTKGYRFVPRRLAARGVRLMQARRG